jgi:hypothetical protein
LEKIKFKIDEKSLFYGVYNDYKKGQTATVSTPLNQSNNPEKWRKDILNLTEANCRQDTLPAMLINQCQRSSHSGNEITDVFVFDKLLLNGDPLNTDYQYVMYIKKETDEYITKLNGQKAKNTHLGRLKLHYPQNFIFKSDGYNIDNKKVLDDILKQDGEFAFIVRGFEYNQTDKTLNIITSLIGPQNIRLSTVFIRKKGIGEKLIIDPTKVSKSDILISNDIVDAVDEELEFDLPDNKDIEIRNTSKVINGVLGEEKVFELLSNQLKEENELYHTSKDYKYSPYDIEYIENGHKQYIEVKATSGVKKIFNMSKGELKFMQEYKKYYTLYLITKVKEEFPEIYKYTCDDIMKMNKEYLSTRFYA